MSVIDVQVIKKEGELEWAIIPYPNLAEPEPLRRFSYRVFLHIVQEFNWLGPIYRRLLVELEHLLESPSSQTTPQYEESQDSVLLYLKALLISPNVMKKF